ncbi:Membrane-associated protease RseP, regulator of RpoE activity [Candidatus Methanophagaceae archaeon]|nr:Membrane-associated protease RseP, regulator of RpoE activity [Methanophagales archaeon]
MDTYYLTLVLYIFLIYWFIVSVLDRKGILERYNITAYGPLLMIRTLRGQGFLDSMAKGEQRKRFWRIYANIGTVLVLIVMVFMFIRMIDGAYGTFVLQPEPTALHKPRNWLLIPGFNEYIPMCAWIGFIVALVVHELSHAILSIVEGIKVKSMGLLVALVPIGAFAEPDSEQLFGEKEGEKKKREDYKSEHEPDKESGVSEKKKVATSRERTRILSAGVTSNFCMALIAFVLFFGILFSIQPVSDTVLYVYDVAEGSPAEKYGIAPETFITKIDGSNAMGIDGMNKALEGKEEISLTVLNKKGKESVIAVKVDSEREGVLIVHVERDTPAAKAGLMDGMSVIRMDNKSITGHKDFHEFMNHTLPGQEIEVQTGGETFIVELAKSPYYANRGYLGVFVANDLLGMAVAKFPDLTLLRSIPSLFTTLSPRHWLSGWGIILAMPVLPLSSYGFSKFNPLLSHLYEPIGAMSFLGDSIFFIADVLFWVGWVNLVVGMFNCLPMVPLDGGHIFREMLNSILRVGIKGERKKERISKVITYTISILILLSIVILLAGPYLLPVVGVIGLIAIIILLAVVVAALVYHISVSVHKAPSVVLVVEGANANSDTLKISHHGGDTILDAFANPETGGDRGQLAGDWNNLEVRRNDEPCTLAGKSTLNGDERWNPGPNKYTQFAPGDELEITSLSLKVGDSIVVFYTQTGDILQRTTVT